MHPCEQMQTTVYLSTNQLLKLVLHFFQLYALLSSLSTVALVWDGVIARGTEEQPLPDRVTTHSKSSVLTQVRCQSEGCNGKKGSLMWCLWRPQQARGHSKKSRPIYRRESWAGKKIANLVMQTLIPAAVLWDKSWSMTFSFVHASCNWAPFSKVRTDSPTHTMLWEAQLSIHYSFENFAHQHV